MAQRFHQSPILRTTKNQSQATELNHVLNQRTIELPKLKFTPRKFTKLSARGSSPLYGETTMGSTSLNFRTNSVCRAVPFNHRLGFDVYNPAQITVHHTIKRLESPKMRNTMQNFPMDHHQSTLSRKVQIKNRAEWNFSLPAGGKSELDASIQE